MHLYDCQSGASTYLRVLVTLLNVIGFPYSTPPTVHLSLRYHTASVYSSAFISLGDIRVQTQVGHPHRHGFIGAAWWFTPCTNAHTYMASLWTSPFIVYASSYSYGFTVLCDALVV